MIRSMTAGQMQKVLWTPAPNNILRTYNVRMHVVTTVDNQGGACGFCGDAYAMVAANIYATMQDGQDQCGDCCLGCIAYVLDNQMDINPAFPVIIELAEGCR